MENNKNKIRLLKLRKKIKRKKPEFLRQEGWKHVRLAKTWRQPKGRHSKLREKERARGRQPSTGWGSPKSVKGLTKHGLRSVRIMNPAQIDSLDPKEDAAIIGSAVGRKKRLEIMKKAEEKGVRILTK